jgi:hypothetical protein
MVQLHLRRAIPATIALSLLCVVGCERSKPAASAQKGAPFPAPKVVTTGASIATVGVVELTVDELAKRAGEQGPVIAQRMTDPDKRIEFAKQQLRFELLAQEAWARGMAEDPAVLAELKKLMVGRLVNQELDRRLQAVQVSEEELRKAYAARSDEFNKAETVRLAQLVRYVGSDAERKAAHVLLERTRAEVLRREKANQPTAFAEAARRDTQDEATRASGGESPFVSRAELEAKLGAEVARVAFEGLQVGDMVVADAANAVVLLKKTGLRHGVSKTLEQVKPSLRAKLIGEKRSEVFEAFVAELEKKYAVRSDLERLRDTPLWPTPPATTSTRAAHEER